MLPGRPEGRRRCRLIDRGGFQNVQPLGKMGRDAQRVRADSGLNAGAAPAGIDVAGAVGVIRLGDAFLSSGASRVLFLAGEKFVPNPAHALLAFCHALPGCWYQMTVMLSPASCIDWAASLRGVHDAGELIGLAEKRGQLGGCKVFLPYLSGERAPQNDPSARGLLMGLDHDSDADGGGAVGDITVIDANRGDPQDGWNTDQFRMAHLEITHSMAEILRGVGFTTGGFNFYPKVRRQSIDAADLFYGHVGSLCVLARGSIAAASILEEGELDCFIDVRYAGWNEALGKWIMDGASLEAISAKFVSDGTDPPPRYGRHEWLGNILNRHL